MEPLGRIFKDLRGIFLISLIFGPPRDPVPVSTEGTPTWCKTTIWKEKVRFRVGVVRKSSVRHFWGPLKDVNKLTSYLMGIHLEGTGANTPLWAGPQGRISKLSVAIVVQTVLSHITSSSQISFLLTYHFLSFLAFLITFLPHHTWRCLVLEA